MKKKKKNLAKDLYQKVNKTIKLVNSSLNKLEPFQSDYEYSSDESIPYDALSGRFTRSVEMCVKFFRTYERIIFGESSDTYRQLLNNMEKINLISSVDLWIDMRDVRNRIVYDYLPDVIKQIFDDIMGDYSSELNKLLKIKVEID